MTKLSLKTIAALAVSGFLSLPTSNASNLSDDHTASCLAMVGSGPRTIADNKVRMDVFQQNIPAHLQKAAFSVVPLINPKWVACYVMCALGGDEPEARALHHAMVTNLEEIQAFYAFVKEQGANPNLDLGFSPALTKTVRAFARKYDPQMSAINLVESEISLMPAHLWFLKDITRLELSRNNIKDVRPFQVLTQLDNLDLSSNGIEDVTPLQALTKLAYLNLSMNRLEVLASLEMLDQLKQLYLGLNEAVNTRAKKTSIKALFSNEVRIYMSTDLYQSWEMGTKVMAQ